MYQSDDSQFKLALSYAIYLLTFYFMTTLSSHIILVLAGGTGGHIMPALAVAKDLQAKGIQVHWLGTQKGLEKQIVPQAQLPLHFIQISGIRRTSLIAKLKAPWQLLHAVYQSIKLLKQLKPSIVIGFGGFVSLPAGIAARILKIPLLIHEQNAIAGMTNRCLAYLSKQVFQAFPHTFIPRVQAITCGNPIRTEILQLLTPIKKIAIEQIVATTIMPLRLLILGGSQGASIFNQQLPPIVETLSSQIALSIWHVTGTAHLQETQALYHKSHSTAQVKISAFIQDIATAYAWADLVICRAGALTVSELAVAGVPSILVPYPYAVDDHQTKNAMWLVEAGAALLLPQKNLTSVTLAKQLMSIANDRQQLIEMASAARCLAKLNATTTISHYCTAILQPSTFKPI